jgi:uncharacterized membrane protein YfcA
MTPKAWLFLALGLFVVYYAFTWVRNVTPEGDGAEPQAGSPSPLLLTVCIAAGLFFGWVAGGGVQFVDSRFKSAFPFVEGHFQIAYPLGPDGVNIVMLIAIASMTILGAAFPLLMHKGKTGWPRPLELCIGFITNFFDTLGIGSYAPTTAMFKSSRLVDDRLIPGTLNVGHTPPTIAEALIFIAIVEVDFKTLALLLLASALGAWLGAGVVSGWSKRSIQLGMGVCLLVAAALFVIKNLDEMRGVPMIAGGTAIGLSGTLLALGFVGNFMLGALMTLGIGLYAPCLIMISLLGMNPTAAFPIMMGSCAFLMPVASARFVKKKSYALRQSLGLTMGGVPAVLIAAIIVKAMPLVYVRWLVVVVVLYTSISMLRSARASAKAVA